MKPGNSNPLCQNRWAAVTLVAVLLPGCVFDVTGQAPSPPDADVALDAAYHSATNQLQQLDAAREAVVSDLQEIVRLRLEKADNPDVFKVKRYPAGDAVAERRALENEGTAAMTVFRQLRVMQVGRFRLV